MFNFKKSLVAIIAVLTLCSVEARADTFTITNTQGVAYVNTSMDGGPPTLRRPLDFRLSGPGLSVSRFSPIAFGGDLGNVEARDTCRIILCGAGTVVGTNSSFSGTLASWGAMAVVNGVNFDSVNLIGSLNFFSESIVLPNGGDYRVTIPFTFSGEINGFRSTPIFTATLTGQGSATFRFWNTSIDSSNPRYLLYSIEYHFEPVPVAIDIKPTTFPNGINPRSKGRIAVAILTTYSFDATTVDPTTIRFGATGIEAAPVHSATEDVDGDGDIDMIFHFIIQDAGIACGNASASLTGAIVSGVGIAGSDAIETVGCN
jgi:hypothetical protein